MTDSCSPVLKGIFELIGRIKVGNSEALVSNFNGSGQVELSLLAQRELI